MHQRWTVPFLAAAMLIATPPKTEMKSYSGRWDLTVTTPRGAYPSWFELTETETGPAVRVQPREGNVRPAAAVSMNGSRLIITALAAAPARPAADGRRAIPAQPSLVWELTLSQDKLTGIQKRGDIEDGSIVGVRAPALSRKAPTAWTEPESLFNGKDLTGWVTMNNTQNPNATVSHWVVRNGELVNEAQGHNIMTIRKFQDFKLHVEFNLSARANSGIYLRGRYEAQIPPPGTGRTASGSSPGYAIYGVIPASTVAPGNPHEWRTCDITLVGRRVTQVINGVTIVDDQEIPSITGGALDSNEAEPGPIYFQGDHTGGIRYRNITISVPKR